MLHSSAHLKHLLATLLFVAGAAAQVPDPPPVRGLAGSIALWGGGEMPRDVRQALIKRAGGPNAKVILIGDADTGPWTSAGAGTGQVFRSQPDSDLVEGLEGCSLVWISGLDDRLSRGDVRTALQAVRESGGVICGDAPVVSWFGHGPEAKTMGWLPNALLRTGGAPDLASDLAKNPGRIGLRVPSATMLVLSGRLLRVMGSGSADAIVPASATRSARRHVIKRRPLDYNAIARSAIARTHPSYPLQQRVTPRVAKGTVIAVGGGRLTRGVVRRFITAAGGLDAPTVVIPTAQPDPLPERDFMSTVLGRMGMKDVRVLHARTPEEADTDAFLKPLARARAVWFGGGRQWRLVDAYANTKAHRLFHDVLKRGGVIGGSSAGATISGGYLVRGHPLSNRIMMAEGYERGLGFLEGMAIDQHFSQRKRFKDMSAVHARFPQLLGLGIDEATAIVVSGTTMEVIGDGAVCVYDGTRTEERDHRLLASGARYDLLNRAPRK